MWNGGLGALYSVLILDDALCRVPKWKRCLTQNVSWIFFIAQSQHAHTHTHQHRHTHRQSTQRQQRTRSHRNDFLEAPKSMLELLSLSHTLALALTHTQRDRAANRLSTVRWRTDSTRKPQSSYFLCLPLFLLRLWSLGLVNILQVLLGLADNSALSTSSLSLFLLSLLSLLFPFSLSLFSQLIFALIDDVRLIWVQVQHLHFIINDFENGLNTYPGYSTSTLPPSSLLCHSILMMPLGRQSINRCKFMGIKLPHNE